MKDLNAKQVIVAMADGTVFRGQTNIGSSRRVSDFFKKGESLFIVLFEASIGEGTAKDVYFINKSHILWVKPDDNDAAAEPGNVVTISIDS